VSVYYPKLPDIFIIVKNVLIIEENAFLRENLVELLELNQFRAITASDGRSGYAVAKKENPDVIICDLMTPETKGNLFVDLAGKDEKVNQIPVLFFSYNQSEPEIKSKFKNQHDECLLKPFTERKLMGILEKISAA
jgi:DNA-binding response OmpR family regulator